MIGLRFALAGLCAAVLLAPIEASAHAHLDHSQPAAGSHLPKPPGKVTIWFTEALEGKFSTIVVKDAKDGAVQDGKATVDPGNSAQLQVKLKPLPAGTYKVQWRVLSVDTHRSQGEFSFQVDP